MSDQPGCNFELDIYTWPAMQGVDPKMRTTYHTTPAEAIAYLQSQAEAYAYATLQKAFPGGHCPCDWSGATVDTGQKWPPRYGTNGQHPAVIALKADWPNLVERVREIHQEHGGAMIDIAADLLKQYHPATCGWAYHLGWEAAAP